MADKPNRISYKELKLQLDEVLAKLQHEGTDIDEAIKLHEQGRELISKMEKYLENAAGKIKK